MNPFCVTLSTSHYTMAVIMYMRVSEEGREERGGEGRGRGRERREEDGRGEEERR